MANRSDKPKPAARRVPAPPWRFRPDSRSVTMPKRYPVLLPSGDLVYLDHVFTEQQEKMLSLDAILALALAPVQLHRPRH